MTDAEIITGVAALIFGAAIAGAIVNIGPKPAPLPPPLPLDWTGVARRRRDAKRFNEHLKLFASFMNGVGASTIITIGIAPNFRTPPVQIEWARTVGSLFVASMLHISGQLALRLWKSED